MTAIPVPDLTRRRAEALGPEGERWLAGVDVTVAALADRWSFAVDGPIPGASASVVLAVRVADGPAVLKLEVPEPGTAGQGALLERAAGRGYARLLARDQAARALLLERLGDPLGRRRLPAEQEVALLADLARAGWLEPAGEPGSSAGKARELAAFVTEAAADAPAWRAAVDTALRFADRRAAAVILEVVVHGDPHPGNALRVTEGRPGAVQGYVWVDPDGFVADPAYDLGVVLRERGALEPTPTAAIRGWCALLAARTGCDADAIWEWGLLERVSTGLLLLRLGQERTGRARLDSAARLVG